MENKKPKISQDGLSREEKIKRIYKIVSDKTLSYGCIFTYPEEWDEDHLTLCSIYEDTGDALTLSYLSSEKDMTHEINGRGDNVEVEIIGHPVMIGDILDRAKTNDIEKKQHDKIRKSKGEGTQYTYTPVNSIILALYKEKRKPIQEQSDYLVDYVYSLLEATTDDTSF